MKPIVAAAAVAIVVALAVTSFFVYPALSGGSGASTKSSQTVSITSTASSTASTGTGNGLQLILSLNSTSVVSGGAIQVTVQEFNTENAQNNVTKGDLWPMAGLSLGPCTGEDNSVYPFGFAVFSGRYTQANVTQAKPLDINPIVPCPMFLRLVTGYLFQPMNDSAVVLPGTGPAQPMADPVAVSHEYPTPQAAQPLPPGVYTVAAGDEWGALVTVQFTVTS